MKSFSEFFREHATKINLFFKNLMLQIKQQQESNENTKIFYIGKDKKYFKVGGHCDYKGEYRDVAYSICNFNYGIPKEIPTVFHNEYDYRFIIKELAEEFKGQTVLV